MVPPCSHRVSRVRRYSGYDWLLQVFAYETVTLCGWPSHAILLTFHIPSVVRTPQIFLLVVWPLPRSLATTCGISVDCFSSPYLDVSVQAVPPVRLWIHRTVTGLPQPGFPIRKSTDRCLLSATRGISLIAASFFGSWCQGIPLALFVA